MHRPERAAAHAQAINWLARALPRATELVVPVHGGPRYQARLVLDHPSGHGQLSVSASGPGRENAIMLARVAALEPLTEHFMQPPLPPARNVELHGASALEPADPEAVPKTWRSPSEAVQDTLFA